MYVHDVAASLRRLNHDVQIYAVLEPNQKEAWCNGTSIIGLAPSNSMHYRVHFRCWNIFVFNEETISEF